MKAKRGEIERAVAAPGDIRLFLLHGADIAGSTALAGRLASALGPDVERVPLAASMLKADPALLADEAAAFSLFGGRRLILVEGGGDELLDAVAALLEASVAGNPVAIVTGVLKKTSKLLALAESSPVALANASYVPEGRDAERMVVDLGTSAGLSIPSDLARRLAVTSGGDRALIAFEIDKFALYLDAAPGRMATLDAGVVDALSADAEEGDVSGVVDAVLDGDVGKLDAELSRFGAAGTEAIVMLRALSRRILLLVRYRSEVESGNSVDGVMASAGKSLFFRDKPAVTRQLSRWSGERLTTASTRILEAELQMKEAGSLGADAVGEALFAIARAAMRR